MSFEEKLLEKIKGTEAEGKVQSVLTHIKEMEFDGAFSEMQSLDDDNPDFELLRAYILLGLHKYEDVILKLKSVLFVEPENYYPYYFYGLALRNLNFPWEALKYFEKAKSIDENDKIKEQIRNTEGIIKVAENKSLQLIAFKEVPDKLKYLK